MEQWGVSGRATEFLRGNLAWDMTLPWQKMIPGRRIEELRRFHDAGFDFVSLTVADDECWIHDTIAYLGELRAWIARQADSLALAGTVSEIERARAEGKLAVGLHFQGSNPFQGDIGMVQVYRDLGVSHAILAYNRKNLVGDGCHERTDSGLSRFGLKLIAEMNRAGMLVDCTHTGHRTTMEAMEASTAPCIFSHSGATAINDHERNIRDDQIRALAATGGVIGVDGIGMFLDAEGRATTEGLLRHIDHIAQLVGPEHVGLGLDFVYFDDFMIAFYQAHKDTHFPKGYLPPPWHYYPPEGLPKLVEALLARGYAEADVRGILGGNFARVCRQVWGS
ncbi:MAG: membrane dipeptidase [Sneathiellaceae bacterium]